MTDKTTRTTPKTTKKDTLYANAQDSISGFQFDEEVVSVFPDMIQRSVPGYATIVHMIGQLAGRYAQSQSHIYDLGCSLGAATLAMRHQIHAAGVTMHAVDNSEAMLMQCRRILDADAGLLPVNLILSDLRALSFEPSSMMVMNFVLQFIPLDDRNVLLQRIADAMLPKGVFVLSEKIRFEDDTHNKLMIDLHHHFKKSNGYSDLEIAQKRTALENVLIPETIETHKARLLNAGFRHVDCWFQCFNFMSLVATK